MNNDLARSPAKDEISLETRYQVAKENVFRHGGKAPPSELPLSFSNHLGTTWKTRMSPLLSKRLV